jgi:hypothetical protein
VGYWCSKRLGLAPWKQVITQTEDVYITGVAEVTVTEGSVECWGATIQPSTAPVLVASSSSGTAICLRPVTDPSKSLARAAKAEICVQAVSAECYVATGLGALHDESTCAQEWSDVRSLCMVTSKDIEPVESVI